MNDIHNLVQQWRTASLAIFPMSAAIILYVVILFVIAHLFEVAVVMTAWSLFGLYAADLYKPKESASANATRSERFPLNGTPRSESESLRTNVSAQEPEEPRMLSPSSSLLNRPNPSPKQVWERDNGKQGNEHETTTNNHLSSRCAQRFYRESHRLGFGGCMPRDI